MQWYEFDDESVYAESCTAIRESPRALLVRFADGEEAWIPKSQVVAHSEVLEAGDTGMLVITRWLARSREWLVD